MPYKTKSFLTLFEYLIKNLHWLHKNGVYLA